MTKEAFEKSASEGQNASAPVSRAPSDNMGGTTEPESNYDGYVRMGILYIHKVEAPAKHFYLSFGTVEWARMPLTRMTDAMSFYADDLSWNDQNSNNYGDYGFFWEANYREHYVTTNQTYNRTETEERDAHTAKRFHDGFYYSFRLPSDIASTTAQITYTRFQILISGIGELKNNSTNTFNITLKYAHTRLRISSNLSFSWSTGGKYPGVTFSLAPTIGTTYYGLSVDVN